MNIRDFEYLIAIDEQKSFIKAAQKCFISQPALSQQIRKIEDRLGFDIFERDNKNLITTPKGKEVILFAKEIVNSFDKIKMIKNQEKKVRIGLIPTICPYLLPYIVDDLHQKLPDVKFYFLELKTQELLEKLHSGQIEIGIMAYFKDLIDDKIVYKKLYDEEFFLTLSKDSDLTAADFPNILTQRKLILLEEGNCMSDNIKDICSIYEQSSYSDFYATNIETVKNMVRINNGIGLLPKLSCLNSDNLKTLSLKSHKFREVGMVIRKNYQDDFILKTIPDIIDERVSKL